MCTAETHSNENNRMAVHHYDESLLGDISHPSWSCELQQIHGWAWITCGLKCPMKLVLGSSLIKSPSTKKSSSGQHTYFANLKMGLSLPVEKAVFFHKQVLIARVGLGFHD